MCIFCEIANNSADTEEFPENIILDETEHFYVKSALGQFIEGYVLINSKKHIPNYSFLDSENLYMELESLIWKTQNNLSKILALKDFIVFEHGSINKLCFNTTCNAKCIDHAHIHIIPTQVDIFEELKRDFSFLELKTLFELKNFKDQSYIYYQSSKNPQHIFNVTNLIPSQFIRQVLCEKLNIPTYWNWSLYPFREKITNFNSRYIRHTLVYAAVS